MAISNKLKWQLAPSSIAKATALTIGNFDGLHYGHQALIRTVQEISSNQDLESAALLFNPHPKTIVLPPNQHPAQLMTLDDKVHRISQLGINHIGCLNFNQALAQLSPHDFITHVVLGAYKATHLIVGNDFCFGAKRQGSLAWLATQNYPLEVIGLPLINMDNGEKISSSLLRTFCWEGKWPQYYQAVGRHWQCSGLVETGQKIAQSLGCPTLNITLALQPLPCEGTHAAWVQGNTGPKLPALIYFNHQAPKGKRVCEAHILTTYPKHLCLEQQHLVVTPIITIRAYTPFTTQKEARVQIQNDRSIAINFFEKALDKSQLNPA